MNRAELNNDQARMHLATQVRNHLATPGITFPVWDGFDLSHKSNEQESALVRASDGKPLLERYHDILGMSDEEIERAVLELPAPSKKRAKKAVEAELEDVSEE